MRKWYPHAVIALAVVASVVAISQMPDRVPIHWNMKGDVDGWANRYLAGALLPPIMLLIALGMRALPRLDPRQENYAKFQDSYDLVVNATLTLMLVVHCTLLAGSLGMPIVAGVRLIVIAGGVLIVIIANVLPRTRPNWIFGLRTPWTLRNDRVWERSHRAGGYILGAAGLVTIAGAFLPTPFNLIVLMTSILVASVISLVYSYRVSKSEAGGDATPPT